MDENPIIPEGRAQAASTSAIVALVLGILSAMCLGPFAGIPAIAIGHHELKLIRAGLSPKSGEGFAKAGLIIGIVTTSLFTFFLLVWLFFFILGITNTIQIIGENA